MKRLAIIGASGHGKVIADIAKKNGYDEIVFFDDNETIKECAGYPVIGNSSEAYSQNCDVAVAIGNASVRKRLFFMLKEKCVNVPMLIHPNAVVAENVQIGKGTVVMAGAVVNPECIIGEGCIINTCSSVDHDSIIGDFVHVAVGAHLAGNVKVGEGTWIGAGAIIKNDITVCGGCVIGAGAVIVKNIGDAGVYIGVPARKEKMEDIKLGGVK